MNLFKKKIVKPNPGQKVQGFWGHLESRITGREQVGKMMPAIFLFVILMIGYIFLSHHYVKSLKEKEALKNELNELRSEYISAKSALMKKSNQSEVAQRLEQVGVKELRTPPYIIKEKEEKN